MKLILAMALGLSVVFASSAEDVVLSRGISQIVKLSKAGVAPSTIQNYIKNSHFPFKTTADDVATMQKEGVPHEVIELLINRSVELQNAAFAFQAAEMPQRATAEQLAASPPVYYAPAPQPVVVVPPVVIQYADPYPAYPGYYGPGFYPAFRGSIGFHGSFHSGSGHGSGHR